MKRSLFRTWSFAKIKIIHLRLLLCLIRNCLTDICTTLLTRTIQVTLHKSCTYEILCVCNQGCLIIWTLEVSSSTDYKIEAINGSFWMSFPKYTTIFVWVIFVREKINPERWVKKLFCMTVRNPIFNKTHLKNLFTSDLVSEFHVCTCYKATSNLAKFVVHLHF